MGHLFILEPGLWLGEGKISFSASPEFLRFYTKWTVEKDNNPRLHVHKKLKLKGLKKIMS